MILKGKLLDTELIIHGEDHSNIDNKYYEALDLSGILFVEHSNNACVIKPEHEHLFKAHAKGSEWVFYTQKKAGNPNVVCFDTRSERGLPNALEEKRMLDIAKKIAESSSEDVRIYLHTVTQMIKSLSAHREVFSEDQVYFTKSFNTIEGQLAALMKLLVIRKKHGDNAKVFEMPVEHLLPGLAYTLASNLRRLASVSVDIGLINSFTEFMACGVKKIQVFCGKNHLVRLSKLLIFTTKVKITGMTPELEESAKLDMDGDPAFDQKIKNLKI